MKKALALSKLYIDSLYGLSGFTSDLKTNKKAVLKKVSFVILIAASFSGMVVSVKLQEGNGIKFHIVEKKTSPY